MKLYKLKACPRCGGDLARDHEDWRCLQCGAYCYAGRSRQSLSSNPDVSKIGHFGKDGTKRDKMGRFGTKWNRMGQNGTALFLPESALFSYKTGPNKPL